MVNKHCKHFRHEPYMTPNNYDLYFNPAEIPSNIKRENVPKLMPISKIIHVNLNTDAEQISESNTIQLSSSLKVNGKKVNFK